MGEFNFIAELCCNHNGNKETCFKMIDQLKDVGVTYIKLQKRDNDLWLKHKPEVFGAPHPCPENSFGTLYYEHRKKLELDIDTHKEIRDYCHSNNLKYGCSVFDIPSAKSIISIEPDFIKVPSPSNNNFDLIQYCCDNFKKDIYISFGMTTKEEFEKIINILQETGAMRRTVLFVTTSGYPVVPEETNLTRITELINNYGKKCKAVAFSGHHAGTVLDIAAYMLGAKYIERHITLDRNAKGTDHKVALYPCEVGELLKNISDIEKAMNCKKTDILNVEKNNRRKLKWQ